MIKYQALLALGKSVVVTGWNGTFSFSVGAVVKNTRYPELKGTADVDAVLGLELKEDKVLVTVWNFVSSISTDALVSTTGNATLGDGSAVSFGAFVTTCSSS